MIDKDTLPNGWEIKKLGEVGKIVSGGTPSTSIKKYFDGEIAWITPADLSGYSNKYISRGRRNITESGLSSSSAKILPKGSVLFSSRAPIGYTVIAKNEIATNQGFKNIIPSDIVLSDYLYHYLKSSKNLIEGLASGTTFKEISGSKFSEVPIPIPPLPIQQKIVAKIEELFSELDKGKEQLETAKAQLKIYRQAVLKWAFEGKLTSLMVPYAGIEPSSISSRSSLSALRSSDVPGVGVELNGGRGAAGSRTLNAVHKDNNYAMVAEPEVAYKKKTKKGVIPLGFEPSSEVVRRGIEPQLPEGWKWAKLSSLGTWKGGGTPTKSRKDYWENGKILWVSPKDMKSKVIHDTIDKITTEAIDNSSTKLIGKGSILFVVRSGILRRTLPVAITICDVTVNQDLQAFTPKEVSPDYIYWLMQANNDDIRKNCSKDGTTVESIESSLLKNYLVPICSPEEQILIVQEIESRLSVCDKVEETILNSLQQAETLRQSILKKAFEGKLV